jgi:hypothetical protein
MSPKERKAVAETLRTWAAWCEADSLSRALGCFYRSVIRGEATAHHVTALRIGKHFCESPRDDSKHRGPTAATGLLLAAAMVEAGDSV